MCGAGIQTSEDFPIFVIINQKIHPNLWGKKGYYVGLASSCGEGNKHSCS